MGDPVKLYVDAQPLLASRMSGIGHLTLEIIKSLSKRDDLSLVLYTPAGKRSRLKKYELNNVSYKSLPLPGRILLLMDMYSVLPPVNWWLGKGVYLFTNYRNWPLSGVPSLTFYHDATYLKYPETVAPKNRKYLALNSPRWLKRTTKVLTLTQASKNDLISELNVSPGKISIIACGVDPQLYFPRSQVEIKDTLKKYNVNGKYILYVGNIEPRKNIFRLLKAYQELAPSIQKEYGLLLIGGDGWLNEETLTLRKELISKGLRIMKANSYVIDDDLPAIYSGAALLVQPALYEGFGITPLQAMACGTAVAISKIPAFSEVIGDAGIYFDPNSTESITIAMTNMLKDEKTRKKYTERGRKLAQNFTWSKAADSLVEEFDKVYLKHS